MSLHPEILTDLQTEVLRLLAPIVTASGFYLAGGTAVALWFGHRRSEDFDWFAPEFGSPEELLTRLKAAGFSPEGVQLDKGTLTTYLRGVKVSAFEYRYSLLSPPGRWPEFGIDLASPRDLAAMKLVAIGQRGSRKDFVDVHELMRQGQTLNGMLGDYRTKFASDIFPALTGLAYFDDAEREPMPEMLGGIDWNAVKADVSRAVREVRL